MNAAGVKRPKGVWIVSTWMFSFVGLVPMAVALFMYFGPPEDERIMTGAGLVVSLSIGLATIVSAVCAWLGHGWARFALIAVAVIHYGLIAHNLYRMAEIGAVPESRMTFVWTRIARSLITMTVVVLYLLLSRNAKTFFRDYRRMA